MFWWYWAKTLPFGDQSFRALVRERAGWERVEWGIRLAAELIWSAAILDENRLADLIGSGVICPFCPARSGRS